MLEENSKLKTRFSFVNKQNDHGMREEEKNERNEFRNKINVKKLKTNVALKEIVKFYLVEVKKKFILKGPLQGEYSFF